MRNIKIEMVHWLDKKLAGNGLAQHAIEKKDPRTLFTIALQVCVGIREVGGNNMGPMVELIQRTIGGANKEAWCMSFIQTIIAYCEVKTGIKSLIAASEHCMTTWRDTPKSCRVKVFPLPGAIAIWNYVGTDSGHTGGVLSAEKKTSIMKLVEGNTESGLNPQGAVVRDGGGVYFTNRSMKGSWNMKVVGYLKPFEQVA